MRARPMSSLRVVLFSLFVVTISFYLWIDRGLCDDLVELVTPQIRSIVTLQVFLRNHSLLRNFLMQPGTLAFLQSGDCSCHHRIERPVL